MAIPTAICMECSVGDNIVEFPTMRELVAHKNSGHRIPPPVKELPPSQPKGPSATEKTVVPEIKKSDVASEVVHSSEKVPLELVYKWQGRHNVCNSEVKTITVDLGKTHAIIAYCLNCDRNIMQRMVIPIAKQPKQQLDLAQPTFEQPLLNKK